MQRGLDDELYNDVQNYRSNEAFTARERLAIEYAERFAFDHTSIDDELFDRLKGAFNQQEIMELTTLNAMCVGLGRALQVLDVAVDFDVLWSREPAQPS